MKNITLKKMKAMKIVAYEFPTSKKTKFSETKFTGHLLKLVQQPLDDIKGYYYKD